MPRVRGGGPVGRPKQAERTRGRMFARGRLMKNNTKKNYPEQGMKQTKKSSGGVPGSPAGSVGRDTGWIGVRGVQLGEARGAQMNEGGELRRESRAEIMESWNHGNEESLELGGHALELRAFLPRLLVLARLCGQVRLCAAVAD